MGVRGLHTFISNNVDAGSVLDFRKYHKERQAKYEALGTEDLHFHFFLSFFPFFFF